MAHPVLRALCGDLDLGVTALSRRPDAKALERFAQMLSNAEYWLSFDVAAFEPLLVTSPSPLRELGVAVALRFGDGVDGRLAGADLDRARSQVLPALPADLAPGVAHGLDTLARAVRARDGVPALEARGFAPYQATTALSVHALRAMGRAHIAVAGHADDAREVVVRFGEPLELSATDERGRALPPPEVESRLDAPLWARDDALTPHKRVIVLLVPGEYRVRVPGRATGDRKLTAL